MGVLLIKEGTKGKKQDENQSNDTINYRKGKFSNDLASTPVNPVLD